MAFARDGHHRASPARNTLSPGQRSEKPCSLPLRLAGHLRFGLGDVVNGAGWTAGYTGTMLEHGLAVRYPSNVLPGDCVIYGNGPPGVHCAVVAGMVNGTPVVISHGSEPGPFYLAYNYRPDILQIRRYI